MEMVSEELAKSVLGKNFLGIKEQDPFFAKLGHQVNRIQQLSEIPFTEHHLIAVKDTHILIFVFPVSESMWEFSLVNLREVMGFNPDISEPCFYNQDWYLKEAFIHILPKAGWYLVPKEVQADSRGILPEQLLEKNSEKNFPSAVLCAYTFFAYFFYTGIILWEHDFLWCNDLDANGDRIYVGRYKDPAGLAKNGFSIHRHLKIQKNYGAIFIK